MDSRGLSPVVGKTLEIGIVVLYLSLVTTTMYGGAVPEYRDAAAAEVADRTLAQAAHRIQQAARPRGAEIEARYRVDLPGTIGGASYELRVEDRTLVLDHPDPAVGGRVRLALPERVERVSGAWESDDPAVVHVAGNRTVVAVDLRTPEGE